MYQIIDGTMCVSVNDWCAAGLSSRLFHFDSQNGDVSIYRRGLHGNTLIDVRSIKRPDRRAAIEAKFGPIDGVGGVGAVKEVYEVVLSQGAREYYSAWRGGDGQPMETGMVRGLVGKASLLESLQRGLQEQRAARAKCGKKLVMGEWYSNAMVWYNDHADAMGASLYNNVRSFERVFKSFCKEGYASLISAKIGNNNARKVSVKMEGLLLALWRGNGKPFVTRVWELYNEFAAGEVDLYDAESGEVYRPEEFRYKDKALEISEATVWSYLKDVMNTTAVYADRNGNFDYQNKMRPKHVRKLGQWSLSKISMDDVALSRKTADGKWVYKYIAVDVLSGYYFKPAYVVGKPTVETVLEAMRNMFLELRALGLGMPAELEVEHHLMENIEWLDEVFPFVRFCQSATEKRAEHAIRSLKYGAAKKAGHTIGRWYARGEAYKSIRTKVEGDYTTEGDGLTAARLIQDDLDDIAAHNAEVLKNKAFGGMTRKEVLVSRMNPTLKPIDEAYLLRYIGYCTETSIVNNNRLSVHGETMWLKDFSTLDQLQSNNRRVAAYWLPEADGSVAKAYLYQGDRCVGDAENMERYRYNEFACERTAEDMAAMLAQEKRVAQFDKVVRGRRAAVPKVGVADKRRRALAAVEVETVVVEHEQPKNYEGDEWEEAKDYAALGLASL